MINLSIIMPMYNSKNISKNLNYSLKALEKVDKNFEIILVDDGSTNNCLKEAKKIGDKRVRVVGYDTNQGKGNAIKYGFNFVRGNYVAFVDSDGDLDPAQLKSFMEIINRTNYDIVIGSKRHPESVVHYPLLRKFMSRVYQSINWILFNLDIKDTQVGIKLFKRKVLDEIMPKIAIKRFAFDLELLVIANKYNFRIVEAPIAMEYKFESTVKPSAIFWMLWDTIAIFYRDKILNYYG